MANNCLVTKLKGVVDNDALLKFGEVSVKLPSGLSEQSGYIGTSLSVGGYVRIIGDGYFTVDGQHVKEVPMYDTNISSRKYLTTNEEVELRIYPKYDITLIDRNYGLCTVNAEDFKFFADKIQQCMYNVIGDFDASKINANVDFWQGRLTGSGLYGDITNNILNNTYEYLYTGPTIRELFKYNKMTADISVFKGDCYMMQCNNNPSVFSWKHTRGSSRLIIAFPGGDFNFGNDLDAMLIDQANGGVGSRTPGSTDFVIDVIGTRTSASDNAVAVLKTKGFTVIVNGETL